MRMINKIMQSMRDTGLLDGMSDEDVDTIATAALEAMREPSETMLQAYWIQSGESKQMKTRTYYRAGFLYVAMIDAALIE